jgi:hypothetical protein
MTRFEGFATAGIRDGGYYSESEHSWLVRPREEWEVHDGGSWLGIGGPGVDGISWALRKGEEGVFAHYPIEKRFEWKAKDVESLIAGWIQGQITV